MTQILRVFEEVYTKEEYCVICFRPASERRMVDTGELAEFIERCSIPFNYLGELQRVCWLCSRAVATAMRVRRSLELSHSVHGLFSLMELAPSHAEELAAELRGEQTKSDLASQAVEWEEALVRVRARSNFLRTDVLVVHSFDTQLKKKKKPRQVEPEDVYIVPESPPRAPASPASPPRTQPDNSKEMEIVLESIVIEDDKDPIHIQPSTPREKVPRTRPNILTPKNIAPKNLAPKNLTPNTVAPNNLNQQDQEGSYLLHPIVNNQGIISVPTLNAQIVNGQLMRVDNANLIIQTPTIAIPDGLNLSIMSERRHIAEFLSANINLPKISMITGNSAVYPTETAILPTSSAIVPTVPSVVPSLSSLLSNNSAIHSTDSAVLSKSSAMAPKSSVVPGQPTIFVNPETQTSFSNLAGILKEPPERHREEPSSLRRKREREEEEGQKKKQKETDWEDKIPMDVISYMNATDPHAEFAEPESNTVPPLGYISNVQSISKETFTATDTTQPYTFPGINNANLGINNATSGINDASSRISNATSGINNTTSGINNTTSEINSATLETNSANSGIISVSSNKKSEITGKNTNTGIKRTNMGINRTDIGINRIKVPVTETCIGLNGDIVVQSTAKSDISRTVSATADNTRLSTVETRKIANIIKDAVQNHPAINNTPVISPKVNKWGITGPSKRAQGNSVKTYFNSKNNSVTSTLKVNLGINNACTGTNYASSGMNNASVGINNASSGMNNAETKRVVIGYNSNTIGVDSMNTVVPTGIISVNSGMITVNSGTICVESGMEVDCGIKSPDLQLNVKSQGTQINFKEANVNKEVQLHRSSENTHQNVFSKSRTTQTTTEEVIDLC